MTAENTGGRRARRRAALRAGLLAAAALAAVAGGGRVSAGRALVETAALSALGQSAAVYLHVVDPGPPEAFSAPLRLPGAVSTGPPRLLPSAGLCLAGSGPDTVPQHPGPGFPDTAGSLVRLPELAPADLLAFRAEAGWREWPAAVHELPGYGLCFAAVAGVFGESGRGRLRLHTLTPAGFAPYTEGEWPLSGQPAGVVFTASDPEVTGTPAPLLAALCAPAPGGVPELSLCVPGVPQAQRHPLSEAPGWNPACGSARALAVSPRGGRVAAVVSGTALDGPSGEPFSLVFFFDLSSRAWAPAPARLRGEAGPAALHFLREDACRAGTTVPGTDFAYVARLDAGAGDEGWTKTGETALTGAAEGFVLASAPDGGDRAAVALGRRLEIWPEGLRGAGPSRSFDAPVRVLAWDGNTLLAGEASRVHRLDPATAEGPAVTLQSGQVTAIAPLPGMEAPAAAPSAPVPPAPQAVELRGAAAGRELRALNITAAPGAAWTVDYSASAMPWLVLHPRAGTGPGTVYAGADPARLPAGAAAEGFIRTQAAGGAAADTLVRVRAAETRAARMLWVCPGGGAEDGWPVLRARLSGPPAHLSHTSASAPLSGGLGAWRVVAANARALASGYFARQQLQEHVSGGGGLLVIGGETDTARALALWLAPFGFAVGAAPAAAESTAPGERGGPLRFWPDLPAGGAVGFSMLDPGPRPPGRPLADFHQARGSGGGPAVLMARAFGHGRVAALSSPALLDAAERGDAAAARFVEQLAVWLARGAAETADMDGDGLADDLEDVNGNGARDPGETDWLRADTDGDGVPDGMEDWNRNGVVDPGETDPRNADSDGDGLWDGADPDPAPVYGTPYIAAVEPSSGPAEGGSIVVVTGRGLPRDAVLWFGDRRAEWSPVPGGEGALARVPESAAEEGTVDVRVEVPGSGLRGVLPGGYRYTGRTAVSGRIAPESFPDHAPDGAQEGRLRILLSSEGRVRLRAVLVALPAPRVPGFAWLPERTGGGARAEVNDGGALLLLATPPEGLVLSRGETVLATVAWRLDPGVRGADVALPAWGGTATADHGGRLLVRGDAAPWITP